MSVLLFANRWSSYDLRFISFRYNSTYNDVI